MSDETPDGMCRKELGSMISRSRSDTCDRLLPISGFTNRAFELQSSHVGDCSSVIMSSYFQRHSIRGACGIAVPAARGRA
jgi:hypothetical protein